MVNFLLQRRISRCRGEKKTFKQLFSHADENKAFSRQNVVKPSTQSHIKPQGLSLVCVKKVNMKRKDTHKHITRTINSGHIIEGHDYGCQVSSANYLIKLIRESSKEVRVQRECRLNVLCAINEKNCIGVSKLHCCCFFFFSPSYRFAFPLEWRSQL